MVPQLLEWQKGYQKGGRELGCRPLSTHHQSQGCQRLGIVFSQGRTEVGGWRGQAYHSVLHDAAALGWWLCSVGSGVLSTTSCRHLVHLPSSKGERQGHALPVGRGLGPSQQAGRCCEGAGVTQLSCPRTHRCLCCWGPGGAGKLGGGQAACPDFHLAHACESAIGAAGRDCWSPLMLTRSARAS